MSPVANEVLGKIPCLVCSTPVTLRANRNDLAYFSCAECGCQVMTRGRVADRKLRASITTAAPPAPTKEKPREEPAKPAPAPKRAGLFGRG